MSKSIAISVAASAIILTEKSTPTQTAFIDVEILRETDKAVLANFKDKEGVRTAKTEWLPKKGLQATKIMGQDVYIVAEWFDHIDGGQIDETFDEYGYLCQTGD